MKVIRCMTSIPAAGHIRAGQKFMKSPEDSGAGAARGTKGENLV